MTTVVYLVQHLLPAQSDERTFTHSVEDLLHRIVRPQGCTLSGAQMPVRNSVRRVVLSTLRAQVTAQSTK